MTARNTEGARNQPCVQGREHRLRGLRQGDADHRLPSALPRPPDCASVPEGRRQVLPLGERSLNHGRHPVTKLYNSLDDEQKGRLAALGMQRDYRRARITSEESRVGTLEGLCKLQTRKPVQRIELP